MEKGTRSLISFDYAVKRLLRNKADYVVLEGFLSELFKRQIKINSILESESNKERADDKFNRVDMLVCDDRGELFIIEIQFSYEIDYFHRMLYGTCKAICDYMVEGAPYADVKKIYSVNIVYFDLGRGGDYIYYGSTNFIGAHECDDLQLSASQREVFKKQMPCEIFPEYCILKVSRFNDVAKDTLDEWIYYLKNSKVEDGFHAQGLQKAQEVLNKSRLNEQERREYEKVADIRRSNDSTVNSAKIEGLVEGEAIGYEKGKMDIIRKSYSAGISVEMIVSISGMPLEEVYAVLNVG